MSISLILAYPSLQKAGLSCKAETSPFHYWRGS